MEHKHDCHKNPCAECQECAHLDQPGYDPVTNTGDPLWDPVRIAMPECSDCVTFAEKACRAAADALK